MERGCDARGAIPIKQAVKSTGCGFGAGCLPSPARSFHLQELVGCTVSPRVPELLLLPGVLGRASEPCRGEPLGWEKRAGSADL